MARNLFHRQVKRKYLMVDSGTHVLIDMLARKKQFNMQEYTASVLIDGLQIATGLNLEQLREPNAISKALQDRKASQQATKMRLRLILSKTQEKHLVVDPSLHQLVTEYAQAKGLTIHEATFFLIRSSMMRAMDIGTANDNSGYIDILKQAYEESNNLRL